MKTCIKKRFLLPALIVGLGFMPVVRGTAQTFRNLHSFNSGSDGGILRSGVILSGNTIYGTTFAGGSPDNGTVFRVNTDGTGFTILHTFTSMTGPSVNTDGASPIGGLILLGNTLYGTTYEGGSFGGGTVFAVNTDGTGFTNLHSLNKNSDGNRDGTNPNAGLIFSGNILYGTASYGGSGGQGTVFAVNTNGTGFTALHSFDGSDGAGAVTRLILSGNNLYGTTFARGSLGYGTVFTVRTDGTGFATLHTFSYYSDGANPLAALILSGNTLYGTASGGGRSDVGTVFAVNTDGSGFTNLHSFLSLYDSEGAVPYGELILSGNTLYGTANSGGNLGVGAPFGAGTVFAINTDGTSFMTMHRFNSADGFNPQAGLILSGNTLYGTATSGGSFNGGTVFSLSFTPQLTVVSSAANVVLTWPTNYGGFSYAGFTLQSTTTLGSPAVWSPVSPVPITVNGWNAVTNSSFSDTQKFYRLSQ